MESQEIYTIDIKKFVQKVWNKRKTLCVVIAVTAVLSSLYIVSFPRYYSTSTKLAPEIQSSGNSTIGSIAASLGVDINKMQSSDAITPLLYPTLLEDNSFIYSLFSIPIYIVDSNIHTTYYDYLNNWQKKPWWGNLFGKEKHPSTPGKNPYKPTKEDEETAITIRKNILLTVNSKNGMITITATDQDPIICKTLADSLRNKLQTFITKYRTDKARKDFAYYQKLAKESKEEYEKVRRAYGSYSDANTDIILQSFRSKQEDLENEMQLKYNTYSSVSTQMENARARIQENTPVFTTLQGATVPLKPAGPKRMIFVLGMMILSSFFYSIWILRKDISNMFNK